MNSPERNWSALELGHWHARNDSFSAHAEDLLETYKKTNVIPQQSFSSLFRNAESHCRGQLFSLIPLLPKHLRDELRADLYELFETRRLSYNAKYEWLLMFRIYIRDLEDLVWTQLGGF